MPLLLSEIERLQLENTQLASEAQSCRDGIQAAFLDRQSIAAEADQLKVALAKAQAIIESLSARVVAQSELLSRHAENCSH